MHRSSATTEHPRVEDFSSFLLSCNKRTWISLVIWPICFKKPYVRLPDDETVLKFPRRVVVVVVEAAATSELSPDGFWLAALQPVMALSFGRKPLGVDFGGWGLRHRPRH